MGNCFSGDPTLSSSSRPMRETAPSTGTRPRTTPPSHVAFSTGQIPALDTARHEYELCTLPPKHNAVTLEHKQPQNSTSPQHRSHDWAHPSLSSDPHSQNVQPYLFRPRGQISPKPHKPAVPQGPHPRSPSHGPQLADAQFESGSTPKTSQVPHFPSTLQSRLSDDFRFRILVVGKRGSGKSSLIEAIFNVDMSRAPMNVTGINAGIAEFLPPDNHRLIVHECSAFGLEELQAIRDFITTRNKSRQASERLHAIWICVPMLDVVRGQFDEGLKLLLGTGVPIVVVFTMFDQIVEYERAKATMWEEHCRTLFRNVRAEIVSTRPGFRDLVVRLATTTDEAIADHSHNTSALSEAQRAPSRMSPVTLAWSLSQRASRDINIQASIEVGRSRYWRRLGTSEDFAGQTLANCVEVIRSDTVGVWNLPDKDRYLSSKAFEVEISHLIQDLSRTSVGSSSRSTRQSEAQGTGAAWLDERYENRNEYIRIVAAYIVDLNLILCEVFDRHGNVSPAGVQSVINDFAASKTPDIHAGISRFLKTAHQLVYKDKDVVLAKIIDLINQNCDSSSVRRQMNPAPWALVNGQRS